MKNFIFGAIIMSILFVSSTAFAITFGSQFFRTDMIGFMETSTNQKFEIHKFVDGDTTCYMTASADWQNVLASIDCVK